jgi:hypothetical protein
LIAYRLYLIGYKKITDGTSVPRNHSVLKDDDPYPITVFGLDKPLSSNKIGNYLNGTFYHYLMIYKNIKRHGLPYKNWLDAPYWLLDLVDKFDGVSEEYARYRTIKGIV